MADIEKLLALVYEARVHADEECDKRDGCSRCPYDAQADMCQNIPIADHLIANGVVVREKGEWRRVYEEGEGWVDICTRCKEIGDETNFCPNCGADMRKGENDGV